MSEERPTGEPVPWWTTVIWRW